jgi:hypothetical protein
VSVVAPTAPTAQIDIDDKHSEEPLSTTATVQEQETPSFQVTSSVKQPEHIVETTEEIIVETQVNRVELDM